MEQKAAVASYRIDNLEKRMDDAEAKMDSCSKSAQATQVLGKIELLMELLERLEKTVATNHIASKELNEKLERKLENLSQCLKEDYVKKSEAKVAYVAFSTVLTVLTVIIGFVTKIFGK